MQFKDNHISISCLPGLLGESRFCVEPNGKSVFIFDFSKISFVQVNVANGRQTSLKTEFPKRIEAPQDWCCIHAVTRNITRSESNSKDIQTPIKESLEKTFLLALILENGSKKFFIVSFTVEDGKADVIHELYSGIDNNTEKQIFCNIIEDERRQIYCLIYWNNLLNEKTGFHAFKINISDRGRISTEVLFNTKILDGNCFHPFVFDDSIHWLPRNDAHFNTLLEISLRNDKKEAEENKVSNEHREWIFSGSRITQPALIYSNAVFYVCNEKQKSSQLCYFDCKRQCWQKVVVDMNDHIICGARIPLKSLNDGRLCLHGACTNESCTIKTHIYVLNIRKELEKNAARWDENEFSQQPNYELKKLGHDLLYNAQYLLNDKRQPSSTNDAENGAESLEMNSL